MANFYDPISERWFDMQTAPLIDRYKPPTLAEELSARSLQTTRVAAHAHLWDAIVSTATATQMSTPCPDGSESAASES